MAYDGGQEQQENLIMVKLMSEGNLPAPTFDLDSWASNYEGVSSHLKTCHPF
jgi:hypothetical protein